MSLIRNEMDLLREVQVEASKLGARVFRNNSGTGWVGQSFKISNPGHYNLAAGDVVVKQGRPLIAGLGTGSSDLIGLTPVVITERHVGQTLGIFTSPEIKWGRGRLSKEQAAWLTMVNNNGGLGIEARSIEDVANRIKQLRGIE